MEHNIWLAHPIESRIRITDMYSLFKIHYDKDYTFAGEIHNFWECVYVLDGQVCVSAEEKVYKKFTRKADEHLNGTIEAISDGYTISFNSER